MGVINGAKHMCAFGLGVLYREKFDAQNVRKKYNIELLCDNDEKKWGREYSGLPCVSIDELAKLENVFVIIMVSRYEPIQAQLKALGIESIPYSQLENNEDIYITTYGKFDIAKLQEDFLNKEKVYIGKKVFDECKIYFAFHQDCNAIPLYDLNGEIVYIALRCADYTVKFAQIMGILESISSDSYNINDLKNWMAERKVCFRQTSLLSYICYETLKEKEISCFLWGNEWNAIGLSENQGGVK